MIVCLYVCRPAEENACTSREVGDGPMAKKHAGDKKSLDKKKKEKKKVLKRLWCQLLMVTPFSFSTQWTKALELDISAMTWRGIWFTYHHHLTFAYIIICMTVLFRWQQTRDQIYRTEKTVRSVCYVWLVTAGWLTRVFKCLKGWTIFFFQVF